MAVIPQSGSTSTVDGGVIVNNTSRAVVHFVAYEGDTFDPIITLLDENDAPIDLVGQTVKMQIKNKKGDVTLKTLVSPTDFTIAINVITFNSILNIVKGEYEYDLQVTFTTGVVKTFIGGSFTVIKQITT